MRPETWARLRAFVDIVQLKLDGAVDAVKPKAIAAQPSPAADAEDLIEEVDHGSR